MKILSLQEKLHSKRTEEQHLRKVAKLLYIFLTTLDKVVKFVKMMQSNYSDNYVHWYNIEIFEDLWSRIATNNTKLMVGNKLKELSELNNFKVETILDHKKKKVITKSSIQELK